MKDKIIIEREPCSGGYTATLVFLNDQGVERSRALKNKTGSPIFTDRQLEAPLDHWRSNDMIEVEDRR
jgi:hypothetical protein